MGQWTAQGFVASDIETYKAQLQTVFTNAFGPDFIVDDDTLPQGILIQELAEILANADADSIEVLTQLNPNTVSGMWLDLIAMVRGVQRNQGSPQVATVSVVSNPGALPLTIPSTQVFTCNETGEQFVSASAQTVSAANDTIRLDFVGEGNSTAAVGNHFSTQDISGIITMEITGFTAGQERETDVELRNRLQSYAPVFNPTIEHILNEIKLLPNIRGVGCAYNDTDQTSSDGIPAYCTEFLVAPTANIDTSSQEFTYWKESVGQAILWNKVPGSPTYGNVTVNIADPFGTLKDVNFSVPEEIKLAVKIVASVNEQVGAVDVEKMEEIKQNIADYINSLPVGVDVPYSRIMQIFMAGSSMNVNSVTLTNVSSGIVKTNQNYIIETRQYAECDSIEVDY